MNPLKSPILPCVGLGLLALGVNLPAQTVLLDFNSLVEGQVFETNVDLANPPGVPDNQPFLNLGVTITATGGQNFGVLYNTEPPEGGDEDLEGPSLATQNPCVGFGCIPNPLTYWPGADGNPLTFGDGGNAHDKSAGLAFIVQENAPAGGDINDGVMTSVPADDNGGGGTMLFEFSSPVIAMQFDWADLDGAEDVTIEFRDLDAVAPNDVVTVNFLAFVDANHDPTGPSDNQNCPGGCFFDNTVFFEDSTHNILPNMTVQRLNDYAGFPPGTFTNFDEVEFILAGSGSISQIRFTFAQTGAIGNFVFNDTDCDGNFEAGDGDSGLAGIRVLLYRDNNGDGMVDGGDTFVRLVTTTPGGNYNFPGMETGDFVVDIDETSLPPGVAATTPVNLGETITLGEISTDEDFGFCNPLLPIRLDSFKAYPIEGGSGVQLDWVTATEIDSAGFHILSAYKSGAHRGAEGAEELDGWQPNVRLTDSLIAAVGSGSEGASYDFLDARPLSHEGEVRAYYLEEIDLYGNPTLHGPFVIGENRAQPLTVTRWSSY